MTNPAQTTQITHVLCDCDGTLVDSEIIAMRVAIDLLADAVEKIKPGVVIERDKLVEAYAGWHFDNMIKQFETDHNVQLDAAALTAVKTTATLEGLKAVVEIPHMGAVLQDLSAAGKKLSIVTSSEFSRVNPCVTKADMDIFFPMEKRYSAHDTLVPPQHKPSPAIYLHALEAEGTTRETAVALEDSRSGVRSSVAAGIPVIGIVAASHISDKNAAAAELLQLGANIVVHDARDIPAAIAWLEDQPMPSETYGKVNLPAFQPPFTSAFAQAQQPQQPAASGTAASLKLANG